MKIRPVLGSMLLAVGSLVPFSSAQMVSLAPGHSVAQSVVPVRGITVLNINSDDAARAAAAIAKSVGAHLGRSPRGNAVVSLRVPAAKLDDNCVYPIINNQTGARSWTFAGFAGNREALSNTSTKVGFTGMVDRNSKHTPALTGDILMELSFQPVDTGHTRLEFWSNCSADTELGRVLASSTGKFERAFLAQLAPGLNLDTWTAAASATADVAAELDYRARSEFDLDDIHRSVLRHLQAGAPERTLVKAEIPASIDEVWRASQRATLRFAELRGLPVMRTDERFHQIQNGDASVGGGDRAWREDFTTTISDNGGGRTRISVVRRLLVPSPDNLTWQGYPSDGEMESWMIGAVIRELTPARIESNETRGVERPSAPLSAPIPSDPSPAPPSAPIPSKVPSADVPSSSIATEVAISSSVENADVYVDGHFVGNAPMPNYRLSAGTHTIEVRAAGYKLWTREITVAANAATRVAAQLLKLP